MQIAQVAWSVSRDLHVRRQEAVKSSRLQLVGIGRTILKWSCRIGDGTLLLQVLVVTTTTTIKIADVKEYHSLLAFTTLDFTMAMNNMMLAQLMQVRVFSLS